VRLALLNYTAPVVVDKPFSDLPWHLLAAQSQVLHLNPGGVLSKTKSLHSGTLVYPAYTPEAVTLTYDFPAKTTFVGPSTLIMDVSSPEHDNLDIYTHIFKANSEGTILSHKNIPTPDTLTADEEAKVTHNRVFRCWGPSWMLRASQRHISIGKSDKTWNTLSYERAQKVQPGSVVRLEIQLWPTGIIFNVGEKLVLKIRGEKLGVPALPFLCKGKI
jgi:predicted acyl esterase